MKQLLCVQIVQDRCGPVDSLKDILIIQGPDKTYPQWT